MEKLYNWVKQNKRDIEYWVIDIIPTITVCGIFLYIVIFRL